MTRGKPVLVQDQQIVYPYDEARDRIVVVVVGAEYLTDAFRF
jgi:hypothetical protein